MSEPKISNERDSSQLLINNESSAVPNFSDLDKNSPVQTYAFIDLETSGTNGTKITEFAVIAVSRYDLEKMQTRIRTAIPLKRPGETRENSNSVHIKFDINSENKLSQNENISLSQRVKRQLFAAASHESVELDSSMETAIELEDQSNSTMDVVLNGNVSSSVYLSQVLDKVSGKEILAERIADVEDQQSNKRPRNQEQEITPRATVDVATDTVGLVQRHCNSHYYKVPKLPRRMTKLTQLFNPKKLIYPENEDVTGLNNIGLEDYPILSDGFCNAFKELILNLPKPVCLVAHYGEKYDFPIIVSEFLHATNCQFDWGDVVYADSLEVLKLLDKIETHLEIHDVQSQTEKHLNWFLDDSVFAVPSPPLPKRRCIDAQPHNAEGDSSNEVNHWVNPGCSDIGDPQPGCNTSNGPCTPVQPTTSDAVKVRSCQKTPKRMVMQSPLHPCPETPVTPSSSFAGSSSSWSIRNRSPSPCGSLITPPQSPVANTSAGCGSSSYRHNAPRSASKSKVYSVIFSSPLFFQVNGADHNEPQGV